MLTTGNIGTALDMYTISATALSTQAHMNIIEVALKAFGGVQMVGTPAGNALRIAVAKGLGINSSAASDTQAEVAALLAAAITAANTAATGGMGTITVAAFVF